MIGDSSSLVFWLPPVFALVTILGVWLYYESRKDPSRESHQHGRLYQCVNCGCVYDEPRQVPMARCPRCDHINEAPLD